MQWFSRASFPAPAKGFAAIDLETTGLYRTDRVVEIAVIQLDPDLSPCGEFATLVQPGRDIGPTHIHRITARDVIGAPRFEQVAPMLLDVLRGRVLVAHNVQFDLRFLRAEFARIGVSLPELPLMCTMQLAPYCLPRLPGRSLAACCDAAGIPLDGAHAAAVDARAVARLLACYARANHRLAAGWAPTLAQAALVPWPTLPPVAAQLVTREIVASDQAQEVPFLARLVQQLPRSGGNAGIESYLAVLDTALEDRRVTSREAEGLHDLAVSLGLGTEEIIAAHQAYLRALAVAAWADGVITDAEYADLGEVARLLGFPAKAVDFELAATHGMSLETTVPVNGRELHEGDAVCITGSTAIPREELEARAHGAGLRVTGSVSRKTRLVIAADPDSESGKARRARELGIPLIAEQVFLAMLQRGLPPDPVVVSTEKRPADLAVTPGDELAGPKDSPYDLLWMRDLPDDAIHAIKVLREALVTEANVIGRHVIYAELEAALYQSRDDFTSALDDYDEVCKQHDAEMDGIRAACMAYWGKVPVLDTYRQMAIRQQRRHDHGQALWWARRGIALYGDDAARPEVVDDLRKRAASYQIKVEREARALSRRARHAAEGTPTA